MRGGLFIPVVVSASLLCGCLAWSGEGAQADSTSTNSRQWVPSQIKPTQYPLKWSDALLGDRVQLDEFGRRPVVSLGGGYDADGWVFVLACERPDQLDCVESLGVVDDETGEYWHEPVLRTETWDVANRPGTQPFAWHRMVWSLPGVEIDGYPGRVFVVGILQPNGGHAMALDLEVADVPARLVTSPDRFGCTSYSDGACERLPLLPEDLTIRVVLRTSWLDASVVLADSRDPHLVIDDLANGAHRLTVTGKTMMLQTLLDGPLDQVPQAVTSKFAFTARDPRTGTVSSAPPACFQKGPLLVAYNANHGRGGGVPEWIASEGRLNLTARAPHYWADGKTPWRGYYETSIPVSLARCMWGIDPRMTAALKVEVYGEDGEERVATTSIGVRDGQVIIRAYDFTYSAPTISIKVTVKAGQRCFQRGAQIGKFFCTRKGKGFVWVRR